ncbi:hypothetical protein AVEN_87109-1 [Araneus ventricosus]|uniref:Uncharacterized protein n=1 Tax=Araneus ventricosus TaxID=182803 RepID=A0A4Y2RAY4_ARAVE|nr:hypothetical protein AVEN_87109-1 [Araneus ventricosus]
MTSALPDPNPRFATVARPLKSLIVLDFLLRKCVYEPWVGGPIILANHISFTSALWEDYSGGGVNDHPGGKSPIHVALSPNVPVSKALEEKCRLGIKELRSGGSSSGDPVFPIPPVRGHDSLSHAILMWKPGV